MVDKTRNPRRDAGEENKRPARAAGTGKPGPRTRANARGRAAGKPATGPAQSRTVAGVDRRAMEMLEREGLLTQEGRRALTGAGPTKKAPEFPGARAARGGERFDRGDRPERGDRFERGERPERGDRFERGDRPERGDRFERGERPERGERTERAERTGAPRTARPGLPARTAPGPRPGRPIGGRKLTAAEATVAERLHKVMARAGVASRRHSEELIQAGRVTVNGKPVTELGTKVVPGRDVVEVDGRPLGRPEDFIYILLNKPKGYVTTLYDPQGREKVTDLLGDEIAQRVYPVGRLDYDTEGLLLLTNDGDLANSLMHPARQVKKTYIAKVRGVPGPAKLHALEEGIELDDGPTAPAEVKLVGASGPNAATVSIRIHEGRNRQVRRMFEALGHEVIHLKRTTLGPLNIKDLPVGQWRELTDREVSELKASVGMRPPRAAKVAAITEKKRAMLRRGGSRPGQPDGEGGDEAAVGERPFRTRSPRAARTPGAAPRAGSGKNRPRR